MHYYSTRNPQLKTSLREAILQGLAPDGGLYMPERIAQLPANFLHALPTLTLPEIAFEVAREFVDGDMDDKTLRTITDDVMNFDIPLVQVAPNKYSLELFHGPTCAFKDVGARFMARLMAHFATKPLKVIVATSGDTGSAVAAGFFDIPNIEVYILYPQGKVSPLQEKQLSTWGKNIKAIEIKGTFDDCQKIAKALLSDKNFNAQHNLTSANSINIARLIPQSFYYFWAYAQLLKSAPEKVKQKIAVCVPSGNFGNLSAGLFAQKMGLPITHFIAATNANDVVPKYLHSGIFHAQTSVQTISNAMDVGNPSNFERMKNLFHDNLAEFKAALSAQAFSDDETRAIMQDVYQKYHYVLDPHGAVAYLGLSAYLAEHADTTGIFLETAHPAKFLEIVESVLNKKADIPAQLAKFYEREKKSVLCEANVDAVKALI